MLRIPGGDAHNTKPVAVVEVIVVVAIRGTATPGNVDPRAATYYMIIIIICQPSTAITWRIPIVIMPIVFAPLPNIATHVI